MSDHLESTTRRRAVHKLKNGKSVEIHSLGLADYTAARDEALRRYKRQRLETYTGNADLVDDPEIRRELMRDAFEKIEQISCEDLPSREMEMPVRDRQGQFVRDRHGNIQTKIEPVEYAAWWMSKTPEGQLFMTWLSMKRGDPSLTLDDADEVFRDAMEDLETIVDRVGEISEPTLAGNSPTSDAGPTTTAEVKRKERRKRRRRTGR